MDTKRNKNPEYIQHAAELVKAEIENWQPNVVIASDDNAAKYVIKQYYKDAETPFVFCGVNWTAREYGFPYRNVTGIIEVAPLKAMLSNAVKYSDGARQAIYLGADTLTEKKNLKRVKEASEKLGIDLQGVLVSTAEEWKAAYTEAQQSGFVVMGSYSGIKNWDKAILAEFATRQAKRLVVTESRLDDAFQLDRVYQNPQEQGEWAAQAAIEILDGKLASDIPIVANRQWDLWVNNNHLNSAGIKLPRKFLRKAKKQ